MKNDTQLVILRILSILIVSCAIVIGTYALLSTTLTFLMVITQVLLLSAIMISILTKNNTQAAIFTLIGILSMLNTP